MSTENPVIEEKPKWTPSYPGELPPVPLSQEQIASLESTKASLVEQVLAGYRIPALPEPVVEKQAEPIVIEEVHDLNLAGLIARAEMEATLAQNALNEELQRVQREGQAKLVAAQNEIARLKQKQAIEIDLAAADRLKTVVAAMKDDAVGEAVLAKRESAGEERMLQLRRRVAGVLKGASDTRRLLSEFDAAFKSQLESLRSISYQDWMLGITQEQAQNANRLYDRIYNGEANPGELMNLNEIRSSLDNMLSTSHVRRHDGDVVGGYEVAINEIIEEAGREPLSREAVRELNHCVSKLALANSDAVMSLQQLAKGVIGMARRLHEMKIPTAVEPVRRQTIKALPEEIVAGPVVAKDFNWNTNSPLSEVR
jgi:hypothetical protein